MTVIAENKTKPAAKMPDGPKTPKWLATIRAILAPLTYIEKAAKDYGDIYTAQFAGFPRQVVVSNPQAIQEIFTADPNLFDSGVANKILQPITGDYSLLLHDGDYHQRQRRLLIPPFHGERMRAYGDIICQITEEVMSQLTIGKTFVARSYMQEISLRVILRAVFGLDENSRFQQLRETLSSMLDTFNSPWSSSLLFLKFLQQDLGPWSPWGRFLRQKQQIDELLYAEIRERRAANDLSREDILSLMLSARDEHGEPMTDAELRDELMTLLFAGHETTATALAWALYWIHYLPEVREKLLAELDSLGDNPDPDKVFRLPYLSAVCSETLRIYPVTLFTFPRIVKSQFQLMGYEFPAGTMLSPCVYLTHHREDIYPEPKRFKPERFLERQFSPYEFISFGGGNRRCIGMAFALFEMKLVLAKILRSQQLVLIDNRPLKAVRRGITTTPDGGVRMVVTGSR
ncbi:cytochrome P450 [Microcoleus sp. FACHB-831]|uniref:cytochrome P450 n=1 Tax=Microcoleus sp. FACHB-831 TaxID=2692827 RepID=UPI001686961E|nr:cytochrome P450 [Microcoleus sp. FACHB-831]MBD1922651.1 cytochrome P450 [Microcoleus sp. FACHB-831]